MNTFRVGQPVVCINDNPVARYKPAGWFSRWRPLGHNLRKGQVYTLTWVGIFLDDWGRPFLAVEVAEARHDLGIPFLARQFRPVRKTSIEVFRQMLVSPPKETVRV